MCDALSSRAGSLFPVTRKGRHCVHLQVLEHSGNPFPQFDQRSRHWVFQAWEASFSFFSPLLLPQCFWAYSTQPYPSLLHWHPQHALPSPGFPLSDHTRVPLLTRQKLPTASTLIMPAFPTIAIHSGSFHQLRLLSSIKRPLPCSHRSYHPHCTDENGEAMIG